MICWIVTDDKAGTRHQCIGLAARLGMESGARVFTSKPRFPWSRLPARLWAWPLCSQAVDGARLLPPWPDVLIVAGRGAVALGPAIKASHRGRTCLVAVQHPRLPLCAFDLVIAPAHDGAQGGVQGSNLFTIEGALTGITPEVLTEGRKAFPNFCAISSPRVAVLIGGGNRSVGFGLVETQRLCQQLLDLALQGASLLISTSRRTPPAIGKLLRAALSDKAAIFWDGSQERAENPYLGILGWADRFLVTPDSISMVSEAACCGKPVQILDLPFLRKQSKFARFHRQMRERDLCRPFRGRLESWPVPAFDETGRAAAALRALLAQENKTAS